MGAQPRPDHEALHGALNVRDRFHIVAKLSKALDEVRAEAARKIARDGYEPVLKNTRWCLLKRPKNLTDRQSISLSVLLAYDLKRVRPHLFNEYFQQFWEYGSPVLAVKFLDAWWVRAMRSTVEPVKKVAHTVRTHGKLLLNCFATRREISAGNVQGLNHRAKVTLSKSSGLRTVRVAEFPPYHVLWKHREPQLVHRFF